MKKFIASFFIVASCLAVSGVYFVHLAGANFGRMWYWGQSQLHTCDPLPVHRAKRTIILRIDDIQAHMWSDVSHRMITDTVGNGIRPVLGVIPANIDSDPRLFFFMKENLCNVEIAQHGLTHSYHGDYDLPEFQDASYEDAYERIAQGKDALHRLVSNPLTTFIPPQNTFSSGTLQAVRDHGFKLLSGDEGVGPYDLDTATIKYSRPNDRLVSINTILADCEEAVAEKGFCVIATHPQDYATDYRLDPQKYQHFVTLLDLLKLKEYSFATFSDLYEANPLPSLEESRD